MSQISSVPSFLVAMVGWVSFLCVAVNQCLSFGEADMTLVEEGEVEAIGSK